MRRRRYCRRVSCFKLGFICFLILILISLILIEQCIRSGFNDITRVKAEEICNDAVNVAVLAVLEENNFQYSDFANVVFKDQSVSNISSNSVNTNKFKSLVAIRAQNEIDNMSGTEITYKLGDFSSSTLFNGRGPDIIIKLYLTSSITTDIISEFESCGVNQTKHTLSIEVTSKVYITSQANEDTYTIVVTRVPIAENIIVGNTPSLYLGQNLLK